jgi:hypothetical protein
LYQLLDLIKPESYLDGMTRHPEYTFDGIQAKHKGEGTTADMFNRMAP